MPIITIHVNEAGGTGRHTLTERVVAARLRDAHYASQLIDRLTWAVSDAERLESTSHRAHAGGFDGLASAEGAAAVSGEEPSRSYALPLLSYRGTLARAQRPPARRSVFDHSGLRAPRAGGRSARDDDADRSAADWLYDWSRAELRPFAGDLVARVTYPTLALPGERRVSRR